MRRAWQQETWGLGVLALLSAFLSLVSGMLWLWLWLATFTYLGWHLYQLNRLYGWIRAGKNAYPPTAWGVWGEIFDHLARDQQRNKKRKQKIKNYLQRFREATRAWPDAVVALDKQGAIEWLNPKAASLLDLHPTRDIGFPITYLIRQPAFVAFLANPSGGLEMPAPGDPQRFLSFHLLPYGKKQKRLLIARDITQLRRLEQLRRDFVANVSHELRTPLTVLLGYIETLEATEDAFPGDLAPTLPLMEAQAKRMQRIVDDLLFLARLEGQPSTSQEKVHVPRLLQGILGDARKLAGDRALSIQADIATVGLWGNPEEIRSALTNLVVNAVQYTPQGTIRVRWYQNEEGLFFEVEDTGIGIEPQHIPRLTERFYRVDVGRSRHSGGTGLGLAIVKHVLARHEGRLFIQSTPGKGSLFRCAFPLSRAVPLEEAA